MLGQLETDPLFVGLTRPPMIFGVSFTYALLNITISMVYLILDSNFYVVPAALVIHGIGYILCFKEPLCVELYLVRMQKFGTCPNRFYYGANSYYV